MISVNETDQRQFQDQISKCYDFINSINHIEEVEAKLSSFHNNVDLKRFLITKLPMAFFKTVEELALPVKCALENIASQFGLEIELEGDARYHFELQLVDFAKEYKSEIEKAAECIGESGYDQQVRGMNDLFDYTVNSLFKFFKKQYKFNKSLYEVVSQSVSNDSSIFDLNDKIKLLNNYEFVPTDYNYRGISSIISNIYEWKDGNSEKKIIFVEFDLDNLFGDVLFKNLNGRELEEVKSVFSSIKNSSLELINEALSSQKLLARENSNNTIFLVFTPNKHFMKFKCLDIYKTIFKNNEKEYLYEYKIIHDRFSWNRKDYRMMQELKNAIANLDKAPDSKSFHLYKACFDFYEDFKKSSYQLIEEGQNRWLNNAMAE